MPDPLSSLIVGLLLVGLLTTLFWPQRGLISRVGQMRQMSRRVMREDALKHMQKAELKGQRASIQSVAGALETSVNQAAQLLAEMEEAELLSTEGETFRLTSAGREYALQIIRAHRLYEHFLAEHTGFDESEWHPQAEYFEHELSLEAAEALSSQLGHPTHDPHGDPIPTAGGEVVVHGGKPLTTLEPDQFGRIVHIEDEPEAVLAQINAEELHPGMQVQMLEMSPQRVRFWAGAKEHVLAPVVATNISVVAIPDMGAIEIHPDKQLSSLRPGEKGKVVSISQRCRGPERRRLMDLGILPGTIIEAEMTSPSGDPTAYLVRGAIIALREEQANKINIASVDEVIQ